MVNMPTDRLFVNSLPIPLNFAYFSGLLSSLLYIQNTIVLHVVLHYTLLKHADLNACCHSHNWHIV